MRSSIQSAVLTAAIICLSRSGSAGEPDRATQIDDSTEGSGGLLDEVFLTDRPAASDCPDSMRFKGGFRAQLGTAAKSSTEALL